MSGIGHNGGPDWGDYGGFIIETRASRNHEIIGYGRQQKPADTSKGFCYSVNEAWRDLLHECNYKDGKIRNGGHTMALRRGEMIGAISYLANRWNWTVRATRTFVDALEREGMVELYHARPNGVHVPRKSGKQHGKMAMVIKACNYDTFNSAGDALRETERQTNDKQATNERQASDNNNKKEKKDKNIKHNSACARPLPDFSYGADDFQLDAKGKLMLVNGERSDWLECFGGSEDALKIALKGFTPNLEYKGQNTLAKHARHYLNQQAQAFNRNAKNAAPAKRARIQARARQRLSDSNKGGAS